MVDPPDVVSSIDERHAATVERVDLFTLRLITYAPAPAVQRWINEELSSLACVPCFTTSLVATFAALADEVRRRVMIIDYDALSKDQLVELRGLRKRHPAGTFIALGQVREHVRAALRITHVLPRPLGSEALRVIVAELDSQRDTLELNARAVID
jgi:hypothetical protein